VENSTDSKFSTSSFYQSAKKKIVVKKEGEGGEYPNIFFYKELIHALSKL
jgi:L-fucose mutarotase/ribose pyranase (RbsD/FucU family)